MIFPYSQVTPQILRPIVTILVKYQKRFALYHGLIDSGADYCIFNIELAKELGIVLSEKDKVKLTGVGEEVVEGYWSTVEMKVDEKLYQTKVVFTKMSEFGYGLLGQKGLFDHFDVTMSYEKQIISLKANAKDEVLN